MILRAPKDLLYEIRKIVGWIPQGFSVFLFDSRSPQGERGLKSPQRLRRIQGRLSLPARGAWIEICTTSRPIATRLSRSPQGERGLKSQRLCGRDNCCVAPRKGSVDWNQELVSYVHWLPPSLPARGAWIEILHPPFFSPFIMVAPRKGSVDWNTFKRGKSSEFQVSLPARGAWIEILSFAACSLAAASLPARGAWIEITVKHKPNTRQRSLPARGAWIEISSLSALLSPSLSLPARGAWIEI